MRIIRIELVGEVAFEAHIKMDEGYRCDVPTDDLGIPYLPMAELVKEQVPLNFPEGLRIGLGRPDGYYGLVREAAELVRQIPNAKTWIRSLYTADRLDSQTGLRIRSLKAGQTFIVPYFVSEAAPVDVSHAVESITHIGIVAEGITGEVRCSVVEETPGASYGPEESPLLTYGSLEYSVMLIAPTTLYAPFNDGDKTYDYVAGSEMRRALAEGETDEALLADLSQMRFSNAYITLGGTRQIPAPMCLSVVKLDHDQLRHRLSPGKDPSRVEQDVALKGAYGAGFDEHFLAHVKTFVERITSVTGDVFDALQAGQIFRGQIFGTDEQLRRVAALIRQKPYITLGELSDEGYGTAYCVLEALHEDPIPHETLMSRFEVACASNTLIYDDWGMPATRPADLLREIERTCGLTEGTLELEGAYTGVYTDYSDRFGWGSMGPVTRCIQAGSVLRVRSADGRGVDVSPILHAFVGEGTLDGYGEIATWPATDEYYRVTKEVEPDRYVLSPKPSPREMHIGADLVHSVMKALTAARVESLADIDALEVVLGDESEREVPVEVLEHLRDAHIPHVDMEKVEGWYTEALASATDRYERLRAEFEDAPDA